MNVGRAVDGKYGRQRTATAEACAHGENYQHGAGMPDEVPG
jgi:hypothetical protein